LWNWAKHSLLQSLNGKVEWTIDCFHS
jgi:hypothetical protein